jgi:hypothetical protein
VASVTKEMKSPQLTLLWALADRFRSQGIAADKVARDYLLTLASLVLLRNADAEDTEREAIASFDGVSFTRQVPAELAWGQIADCSPERLGDMLQKRVWRILPDLPTTELLSPLRRIPSVLYTPDVPADILAAARDAIDRTRWNEPQSRANLAQEFEDSLTFFIST